jgi:phage protein U
MFAIFGEIVFEVLTSPNGFESSRTWDYAEHRVVEDRPKLQWISNALESLELDFRFHISFTDPAIQLDALAAAADDHNARPLVFGNGQHRGYFVVTGIRTTSRQMSADGRLIATTVRTRLREWAVESEIGSNANPIALFPLIGVVAASPGAETSSIAYAGANGLGAALRTPATTYVSVPIAAPGVSPLLNIPAVAGLPTVHLTVGDVAPSTIVRAPRSGMITDLRAGHH